MKVRRHKGKVRRRRHTLYVEQNNCSSESVITVISSLTYSKIAPRFLKSGSRSSCFVIPFKTSSVKRVLNSIGCDAAFRKSIKTFELFSRYSLSFVRAVALPLFLVGLLGGVSESATPLLSTSKIVFRERWSVSVYIDCCRDVISHHSMRTVFFGKSLRTL